MVGSLALVWASAMRRRYRSAVGLDGERIERLRGWFDAQLLASVRVARPQQVRLIGASVARRLGVRGLPIEPAGICLGQVVVIEEGVGLETDVLFHELVHTVQWEVLGKGYEDGGGLEGMARAMTGRFANGERFDVQAEIERERRAKWIH